MLRVEQRGRLERVFLAEIGTDQMRLIRADRGRRNRKPVYVLKPPQENAFDVPVMSAQTRHDSVQFFGDFGWIEPQYPIDNSLRARAPRRAELRIVFGGNERADHDARRIGLEQDRRVRDDVFSHLVSIRHYRAPRTWC